ncbi:hypothetical protein QJS10_CPB20g02126 [Acorus calamus]|uniref:Uncharacterized protein n=1 Tax=Acorus calamus TaxID=4465 RepID=A0AAV9CAJ4_ACOCL|nr:hypothetical protein QJS10_CPB20g02126 [Acorus calamus]
MKSRKILSKILSYLPYISVLFSLSQIHSQVSLFLSVGFHIFSFTFCLFNYVAKHRQTAKQNPVETIHLGN